LKIDENHENLEKSMIVAPNSMIFMKKCYKQNFLCPICAQPAEQRYKYFLMIPFLWQPHVLTL